VRNLLDCVKSRQRPVCDIEIGFNSTLPCLLAIVSIKGGRTVKWDGGRRGRRSETGIAVSGCDRVAVAPLVDPGGIVEVVAVTAEAPWLQPQSGERSFAVTTQQIEHLPINRRNFTSLLARRIVRLASTVRARITPYPRDVKAILMLNRCGQEY
jgi:hypothetical protein